MSTETLRDQTLLQEYLRLCTEIRSIEARLDIASLASYAGITLLLVVGINWFDPLIFFILPLAVIGVWALIVHAYVSIFSLGGYKRHVEDLLNESAGTKVLCWERLVPMREQRNKTIRFLILAVQALFSLLVVAVSVIQAEVVFGAGAWLLLIVLIFLVLLGASVKRMSKVLEETYADAKSL